MAKQKRYYDISNMLKTDAEYMILLGQRSNGKSYQAKLTAIKNAYETGRRFVYMRRWDNHVKAKDVVNYFVDLNISDITNGEWSGVHAVKGEIYFTGFDEEGKKILSDCIGYYVALNMSEANKSKVFLDVDYIIFEEFITDKAYLYDEPRQLQHMVSTIARNNRCHVIMVGNTLSRVCPYFNEWCLEGVLKQKIGTIEVYHFHVSEDETVNIAVEYCENSVKENKMFFGQAAKQIVSGEWDTYDANKLPRTQLEYDMVYEIELTFQAFTFILQLLVEPKDGGTLIFIYPATKKRKIYRKISDKFSDLPNVTRCLDSRIRPEALMIELFRLDKVCYSDNLTASDFKHVNDTMRIF